MHEGPAPSRRAFLRRAASAGLIATVPGLGVAACTGPSRTEAAPAVPDRNLTGDDLTTNGYGHTDADHDRVGLRRDTVEAWEDGFRTAAYNDDPNAFEWWYSDFTGDDGTAVSFMLGTRLDNGFVPAPGEAGRRPRSSVIVTDPDGTSHGGAHGYDWNEFSSARDHCDVRLGPFRLAGDLRTYRVRGQSGDVGVDLTLTSLVRPFRPGTGIVHFGDTDKYFGWLCVVPAGTATGTVTVKGRKRAFHGRGYHDRNWGNQPFPYTVDHWRWGRGTVGHYSVIGADLHLRKEYDSVVVPVFLVDDTRAGQRLIGAFDPRSVTATESDARQHPDPGYPGYYYSQVHWTHREGEDRSDFTFTDTDRLVVTRQHVTAPGKAQKAAMDGLGIDEIWYTRYATTNDLHFDAGSTHASGTGTGTLEAAQFGLASVPSSSTGAGHPPRPS